MRISQKKPGKLAGYNADGKLVAAVLAGHVLQVQRGLQKRRRNLNNFQRAELALVLEPLIAAQAKERQLAGLKQNQNQTVTENSQERRTEKGETAETKNRSVRILTLR